MSDTHADRRKHDLAYACFIPPGLVYLIARIAAFVPMDTGTAGSIGFLVLIPLSLAALVTVPIGIFHAVSLRRDPLLIVLVLATVLMLVQLFAEAGPVRLRNLLGLVYGAGVLVIVAAWFSIRRRRFYREAREHG